MRYDEYDDSGALHDTDLALVARDPGTPGTKTLKFYMGRLADYLISKLAPIAISGEYDDLSGAPVLSAVATSGAYSDLNGKPTIPAAQVSVDWNSVSGISAIQNKPSLATVATSGAYSDLSGKPTIPAAQVNSDWSASSGATAILNKPTLGSLAALSAAPAGSLTGTTLNATVVTSSLTSLGTLTALNVSGIANLSSTSATALKVGGTNPALTVDASAASLVAGGLITGTASGGVIYSATSTSSGEQAKFTGKGTTGYLTCSSFGSLEMGIGSFAMISAFNTYGIQFTAGGGSGNPNTQFYFNTQGGQLYSAGQVQNISLNSASTMTYNGAFAVSSQMTSRVAQQTFNSITTGSVITEAATFNIEGPAKVGNGVTITNDYGVLVSTSAIQSGTGVVSNSFAGGFFAQTGAVKNYALRIVGPILSGGTAATAAAGTGAGTGGTIAIGGASQGGTITVVTGTTPSASSVIGTLTHPTAYPNGSSIVITPGNAAAAALSGTSQVFAAGGTTTATLTSGSAALAAATTYIWNYKITGY
ncbi:MAG: hypothetical protein JWO78_222 [Micavibrio sp.]|nr:hypothetical protein [Micavibrio sp.]